MRRRAPEAAQETAVETPKAVRVPPAAARCFQPSSFASRKADADARNTELSKRRLVSLGESEFTQRNQKTGAVEWIPATIYADWDHRANRFVEISGHLGLIPLQDDSQRKDIVTDLGTVPGRRLSRPESGTFPEARPETPPRSI